MKRAVQGLAALAGLAAFAVVQMTWDRQMRRNQHERRMAALRRLTKAVDRQMTADSLVAREKAVKWAKLWAQAAGLQPR